MTVEAIEEPRIRHSYTSDGLGIVIPAKRNYLVLAFLTFWLCGWTIGGFSAIGSLLSPGPGGFSLFLVVWLCGWAAGWLFVSSTILWQLFGFEKLFVTSGVFTVQKHALLPFRTKRYSVPNITNIELSRTIGEGSIWNRNNNSNNQHMMGQPGLTFDYGPKTIGFARGVDKAEARHIVEILKKHMPSVFKRRGSE